MVLAVLGLSADLAAVARDDELGRKLQDIELLRTAKKQIKMNKRVWVYADWETLPEPLLVGVLQQLMATAFNV